MDFCLNIGKRFFLRGFILKTTEKAEILLKNSTRGFQSNSPFERPPCFYVTIIKFFDCFQYFDFAANILDNEILFQKTCALNGVLPVTA